MHVMGGISESSEGGLENNAREMLLKQRFLM
jgi:hypothetical protein